MECCIATLSASSATMSHALQPKKAARVGVILQGASSAPHFLLARLQRYSFQLVFQLYCLSRVHLAFTLSVSCRLFSRNYVRTSLNFWSEQAVVICQGASSAPHFLLARLQRYSFQLVFQLYCLSRVHLAFTRSVSFKLLSRNYDRTRMNFFREQAVVICQGASSAPHLLLARLQRYSFQPAFLLYENNLPTSPLHGCSFQLAFQTVLPAYTLQLPSITVFCPLLSRNSVRTSGEFSLK